MTASPEHRQTAFRCAITPRYTDLDTWRHVNNSRIYQIHQEARLLCHLNIFGPDAWFSDDVRLRPVRSVTDYKLVTWYGSDVQAVVEVLECQADTYTVRSDLYQNGDHVGTQRCIMAGFDRGIRTALPESVRDALGSAVTGQPFELPVATYREQLAAASTFPVRQQLTPRYADMDADSQRSEAALARYMEQARFSGIRTLDMNGLGILIASADISFEHYRPSFKPVELASGITRIGNTSFVFTGCAVHEGDIQASANSVMVVIDPATNRPAPIPQSLRDQLVTLSL